MDFLGAQCLKHQGSMMNIRKDLTESVPKTLLPQRDLCHIPVQVTHIPMQGTARIPLAWGSGQTENEKLVLGSLAILQ